MVSQIIKKAFKNVSSDFDIVFDNGGGATFVTSDYVHFYNDPQELADSIIHFLEFDDCESWDNNEIDLWITDIEIRSSFELHYVSLYDFQTMEEYELGDNLRHGFMAQEFFQFLICKLILKDVEKSGCVEIEEGTHIMTKKCIMEEQKEWDNEDKSKCIDFSKYSFWITYDNSTPPEGINTSRELIELIDWEI